MKRGYNEKNQPSMRSRFSAGHRNPPFPQSQFRNHRSESVDKAIIRNNSQLSCGTDQINPERLLPFETREGQFRPHLGGQNHRQNHLRPSAMTPMSRFVFGARQIRPIASYPMFFRSGFRSAFNHYTRSTPQGIPSKTRQFQETQRHWNARLMQSRNGMRTSANTSSAGTKERGHRGKAFSNKNKFPMRREWQALPEADQCRPDEFSFSIVTYNILSDSLLYENMFLYEECFHEDLSWGYRKEKLLSELLGYDAEVLCLQEVDACHYENWFLPKLHEAGYTGLFVQRTGGKPDGCAIFFRNAKFSLVNHKLVEYNTPKVSVLDKDNVGIVLLLRANTSTSRREDSLLCIANTHLLFNKKRGDIKLAQLAYLFAEINELAVSSKNGRTNTSCPIILCGDLNSMPYSPLYHFLISGQLEYSARSPAVISGQLGSSEARSGPSSKRIRTPLLPWEFGVTAGCQWRERRSETSGDSCACPKERHASFQHGEGSHVQNSGRGTASDYHSRPADNHDIQQTCLHESNRQTNETHDLGKHMEGQDHHSTAYPNSNSSGTTHIDRTILADSDVNMPPECSHVSGALSRRPEDHGGNRSYVKYDRRSGRQSKGCPEVIDLTSDTEQPSVHEVTIDRSAFEDRGRNQRTNCKPKSDIFDLRADTNSPHHKMPESNSLDFIDSIPQTNDSEGRHHDTPVCITSFGDTDCQSEKSKYNKNGRLSIPWQFTSVYTHRFPDGTPEVTTCHSKACCNVDYIFYTATGGEEQTTEHQRHEQKGELTLLGRLRLMKKSYFDTTRLLPNRIFSSDHLSLQARFKLT